MKKQNTPIRYNRITNKNSREIVMLRGSGCTWRKCRFCDYHLDYSSDAGENFALNKAILANVTGCFHLLEVTNSDRFMELDQAMLALIVQACLNRNTNTVHFECHWLYWHNIAAYMKQYTKKEICLKLKTGVETFDSLFRESYLSKGIDTDWEKSPGTLMKSVCCRRSPDRLYKVRNRMLKQSWHILNVSVLI